MRGEPFMPASNQVHRASPASPFFPLTSALWGLWAAAVCCPQTHSAQSGHGGSRGSRIPRAGLIPLLALLAGRLVPAEALAGAPVRRELRRRPLQVTDATSTMVPEVHVAAGVPTTLAFHVAIKPDAVLVADTAGVFPERTRATSTSVLLTPRSDLPASAVATLTVTLADGTILPFLLTTVPGEADLQVDVDVALQARQAPESAGALAVVSQLQQKLDECSSTAGNAGVQKVATLVSQQDLEKPQAFQRYDIHRLTRQNQLLVEAKQAYRLFGVTYLVLTVQNRSASKAWVFDRAEVAVQGGGATEDLKVSAAVAEMVALQPDETERLVIAFLTPNQSATHRFVLSLHEKDGNRHVRLDDVAL